MPPRNQDTYTNTYNTLSPSPPPPPPKPHSHSPTTTSSRHLSTAALCLTLLCHSYLLISVFPYSGFMAIHLTHGRLNSENAGSYAGLIASSFMIGRSVSSYLWGRLADSHGRKAVLLASLGLSAIWSLGFGLSDTLPAALVTRCLLGLSNGLIGTVKTIVTELAHGDREWETKSMGLVIGMWGWGFLIGPAMSGALAEPVRQYPEMEVVKRWEWLLGRYPFLLPNVVAVVFCVVAGVGIYLFVEETLEVEQRGEMGWGGGWWGRVRGLWERGFGMRKGLQVRGEESLPLTATIHKETSMTSLVKETQTQSDVLPVKQQHDDDENNEDKDIIKMRTSESCSFLSTCPKPTSTKQTTPSSPINDSTTPTLHSIWSRASTRRHLILYWSFAFVTICVDESFPLFCLSHGTPSHPGLGLSESKIGRILSGSGVIFAICQYFMYTTIVDRCGLYGSLRVACLCGNPLVILIPLSVAMNQRYLAGEQSEPGALATPTFVFLSLLMSMAKVFGSIYFTGMSVASNRTVPASQRATMNGLSMVGGSVAKALGPVFAGVLVSFSLSSGVVDPRGGGYVIFGTIALMALIVAGGTFVMLKEEFDDEGEDRGKDLGTTTISRGR